MPDFNLRPKVCFGQFLDFYNVKKNIDGRNFQFWDFDRFRLWNLDEVPDLVTRTLNIGEFDIWEV